MKISKINKSLRNTRGRDYYTDKLALLHSLLEIK